ncbi:hypothetical protein CBR_g38418 [Chara braunii]|uniref:Endonuclease/exonuclease/phosphatase domain-containing protein n=1 Tax=Chara braunii TaxID=69332 RepID=A0A388JNW0_CHABU|nr:hypothetical protein CBR_g38418 [Chara braunii]|eukprot:GBG59392.1 hypothetical protein CBR_g38418 [Chara braunii]
MSCSDHEQEGASDSTDTSDRSKTDISKTSQKMDRGTDEQEGEVEERGGGGEQEEEQHLMHEEPSAEGGAQQDIEDSVGAGRVENREQQDPLKELVRQERAETGSKAILEGWGSAMSALSSYDSLRKVSRLEKVRQKQIDVIGWQETKLDGDKIAEPVLWWKSHQVWTPARGTKRGVCILVYPISEGKFKTDTLTQGATVTVYGPTETGLRCRMWEQLQTLTRDLNKIILAGDFNSVVDIPLDSAIARHAGTDSFTLRNAMMRQGGC